MDEKSGYERKRWKMVAYVAASVVAVVIIAALTILALRSADTPKTDKPSARQVENKPAASASKALEFDEENAQLLEKALNSSDKSEQSRGMVPAMRKGQWSSAKVLPDGATLKVDRETFTPADDGRSATVEADVTGSVEARFVLLLAPSGGQWLLYATQQTR